MGVFYLNLVVAAKRHTLHFSGKLVSSESYSQRLNLFFAIHGATATARTKY